MLFNSIDFLLFFPIVTIVYFLLPHKYRWIHLLAASCFFYMCFIPVYIFILFFTILIDYIAGIMIENATNEKKRWFLIMSVIANVGVLAFFKYYNFFAENINELLHVSRSSAAVPLLKFILPIGLSFHTFQAMSYTIEVYRGKQKAERHFGIYALYVMFYPQLVAGPIERPQNVLHQFHERHYLTYDNLASGMRLILWGMVKKVVIADRLAITTDMIFNNPSSYSGTALALGIFLFAFQIFCDFSGYSDIALGSARVMGFELMVNFRIPFTSKSISEFWRRWHISLSSWFNDYLFNPVVNAWRNMGNKAIVMGLLLTFMLSGVWHGAGWKFVIYGLLHGIAVSYEFLTKKKRKKIFGKLPVLLNETLSIIFTFSFVAFSWIFFRANNFADAMLIVRKLGSIPGEIVHVMTTRKLDFLRLPSLYLFVAPCLALVLFLKIAHKLQSRFNLENTFRNKPPVLRWAIYYSGFLALIYLGVYEEHQFIYFQF